MLDRGAQRPLGRIRNADPRTIWPNEALDFTPWLRQNADLLAEALGIDLEINEAEVAVGGFSVDLVGEDITNGRRLIVENQLEATDHSHLGQLLTYAGGLDAATIIWISPAFRDEHRSAIDWLNTHTDEKIAFFGLQLEVIGIGESALAPNLRPVAMPNEWSIGARRAVTQGEASETALGRQRFFEAALAELKRRNPGLTNARRVLLQSWFSMAGGRTGFGFNWSFTGDRQLRVELYIDTGDAAANAEYFEKLVAQRDGVEVAAGRQLVWDEMAGKKGVRIYVSRPLDPGTPPDEDAELLAFAVDAMLAFNTAFRPVIRGLAAPG